MFKQNINIERKDWTALAPTEVRALSMSKIPHGGYFSGAYLEKNGDLRVEYIPYQPGDIVGVLGGAMSQLSRRIFTPETALYHFLIIGQFIPEEDDYEIFEAIASGVRTGRLSWYVQDLYIVFRLNDPESVKLGRRSAREASAFGRWGYDYIMFFFILLDLVCIYSRMLFKERRIRRVRPAELTYRENHAFICTEFANAVYRAGGRPPIPIGVTPIPAGYIEAYNCGKLVKVGENIPAKYRELYLSGKVIPGISMEGKS